MKKANAAVIGVSSLLLFVAVGCGGVEGTQIDGNTFNIALPDGISYVYTKTWSTPPAWTTPEPGRCPAHPAYVLSGQSSGGFFTYLDGAVVDGVTSVNAHCLHRGNFTYTNGEAVATTDDGSQLFQTYEVAAWFTGPTTLVWESPTVATGGTGKFEGATGDISERGEQNLATGQVQSFINGVIYLADPCKNNKECKDFKKALRKGLH